MSSGVRTTRPTARVRAVASSRDARLAWWLILPTAVVLVLVIGYPAVWAVRLSMFSDSISGASRFVGLDNYLDALAGPDAPEFWAAARTTALFTVVGGAVELFIGTLMALVMHRIRRLRGLVRAFVLVPWAIPTAVAVVLWQWMLTPDGIVNALLGREIIWTGSEGWSRTAVILIDVWKTSPFVGLLLLAGLQTIPEEIYEASRVDGASAWQRFWRITVPLLKPTILVAMLFRVLDLLRMYDTPAILTNGANGTNTLTLFTFQNAVDQVKYGYGSALSTLTFLFIFVVALLFIKGFGTRVYTSPRGSDD